MYVVLKKNVAHLQVPVEKTVQVMHDVIKEVVNRVPVEITIEKPIEVTVEKVFFLYAWNEFVVSLFLVLWFIRHTFSFFAESGDSAAQLRDILAPFLPGCRHWGSKTPQGSRAGCGFM